MHLDLDDAVALTGLAAAPLDVEREAAGVIAPHLGVGRLGVEVADIGEHAGIGGRVRARGAADGRLVDADDLVDILHALDLLKAARAQLGAVEVRGQLFVEDVVDQAGLAAARDAGDACHDPEGKLHRDVL